MSGNKRPFQDGQQYGDLMFQKKRHKPNRFGPPDSEAGKPQAISNDDITTARHLQGLLTDYSNPEQLSAGVRAFGTFVNSCVRTGQVLAERAERNTNIVKEYLEAQSKAAGDGEEGEGQGDAYRDILQAWSFASQSNNISILSAVPATLSVLVRFTSHKEELRTYGVVLCKAILQQSYLKIIYRGLTSNRDHVVSPCLRILTEINRFDSGSLCGVLHSAFDFTVKDLTKNLEVRGRKGVENAGVAAFVEDPHKPSVRTLFVRFILSFFQHGGGSVKNQMLGLRNWISPVFKNIRTDTPLLVNDVLDTLRERIVADADIPKSTKTSLFNEWVLGHIAGLYARLESVKVYKAGREEEKTIAELAHEFLLELCAKPGGNGGACFPDSGWYPPGYVESEEKRRGAPKVFNRALSSFILNVKPYADTLQQDLILAIFKACPELVADYFFSNTTWSFDPKLTSTWIGYYSFLSATVELPIPENFGLSESSTIPPPTNVLVENVIPKPLSKTILTKCLTHENNLIKFFSTRLLIVCFQKLRKVLSAIDELSASMVDPSANWAKTRFDAVEEFCRRVPDMAVVVSAFNSTPSGKTSEQRGLQKEASSRLLAEYFETLPEVALAGKFDVNVALGSFLGGEEVKAEEGGMRSLEMGHLLRVAKDVPDVKWWHKPTNMPFSPFVSILKLCCGQVSSLPLQQVRELLQSFVSPSLLFQTETSASPLDPLLESLSAIPDPHTFNAVLSFLDESIARCIRSPFKYIDDYAELALETSKQQTVSQVTNIPAVSPFIMTVAEQWKFFMQNNMYTPAIKQGGATWLARFLESVAMLGENLSVLGVLCERLGGSCEDSESSTVLFKTLKLRLEGGQGLELGTGDADSFTTGFEVGVLDMAGEGGENASVKSVRTLFKDLGHLDIRNVASVVTSIGQGRMEVSLFDIAVLKMAVRGIIESPKIPETEAVAAVEKVMDALEITVEIVSGRGVVEKEKVKEMLSGKDWANFFLAKPEEVSRLGRFTRFSKRYAQLLCMVFEEFESVLAPVNRKARREALETGTVYDTEEGKAYRQDVLQIYKSSVLQLFDTEDVLDCIQNISASKRPQRLHLDILEFLIQRLSARNEFLPVEDLNSLLKNPNLPETVCSALGTYILGVPQNKIDGLNVNVRKLSLGLESSPGKTVLECVLIKRVEAIRIAATNHFASAIKKGTVVSSDYFLALLEGSSVAVAETGKFVWDPAVDSGTRMILHDIFSRFQESFLSGQTDLLQRAVSLFPSLDKILVMKHIAGDKSLTVKSVALIESLLNDIDESADELRAWLFMVFDHLTRRFAEDNVLSEKVLAFTKRLGDLIGRGKVDLAASIPRVALNAVLEAGLMKHASVEEVVYFEAVVVSKSPVKSLDVTKILQIILGHPDNPLKLRTSGEYSGKVHHYTAYLIHRLFSFLKASQSTITTLDGVLSLYRGSNDVVDTVLLQIISYIEAHLARSCASRIASWSVVENAEGRHLVARVRGKLTVTIDGKTLAKSIFQSSPAKALIVEGQLDSLASFMKIADQQEEFMSLTYDHMFLLPALTYYLISEEKLVDIAAAIENNCVGFAIMGLCNVNHGAVRMMAKAYINAIVAKLEDSHYKERTQVAHLLCALLASLEPKEEESERNDKPLPAVVGVFLAQAVQVLAHPAHFLYEKVMDMLLKRPFLDLRDVPLMLSVLGVGDEYQKEIGWIMGVLVAGLRTEQDLNIYRKRKIFENVLSLYSSPYLNQRNKDKILELLWNAAAVEGGGTTLITRNGLIAWIEQERFGLAAEEKEDEGMGLVLKRLGGRLWEASARKHVLEWSKGMFEGHLREGVFGVM